MRMGFKDFFSKAKTKLNETIEKGNKELARFQNTKCVTIYDKPVLGGFVFIRAFYEGNKLLIPVSSFERGELKINTIIGLDQDEEYYVIKEISEETILKEVKNENKSYEYECYEVSYDILNDVFTDEVDGLPCFELTKEQRNFLDALRKEIESNSLAMKGKKEFCLNLWQYFVECIEYRLKEHYVVFTFSRIANEYVKDFSSYIIKLFA